MEWLINRRRMMYNKAVPPTYLAFEDEEFWRVCCIHYGEYDEVVITDNNNNTVNITTTRKVMRNDNLIKSTVIDEQTNVDNTGGTYVAGTTIVPVGITDKQCKEVTALSNDFTSTSLQVFKCSELHYFINLRVISNNVFYDTSYPTLIALPSSIEIIRGNAFRFMYSIRCILIYATVPPTLGSGFNQHELIFVPDDSVNSYKSASVWSSLTVDIRPISEYVGIPDYENTVENVKLYGGNEVNDYTCITTDYIEVSPSDSISITYPELSDQRVEMYDANKVYKDYYNIHVASRTISLRNDCHYIRITMLKRSIDRAVIYNNTKSEDIFRGIYAN